MGRNSFCLARCRNQWCVNACIPRHHIFSKSIKEDPHHILVNGDKWSVKMQQANPFKMRDGYVMVHHHLFWPTRVVTSLTNYTPRGSQLTKCGMRLRGLNRKLM